MIRFVLRTDAAARAIADRNMKSRCWIRRMTHRNASRGRAWPSMAIVAIPMRLFRCASPTARSTGGPKPGGRLLLSPNFAGLYRRATGQPPFRLAPRWVSNRDQLDPETVFDMSSDNDIIGGNSGSPLLNAKGEVIGAIFDGNIHSLGGAYFFDPKLNRAVSVSTAAMTEALNKVYGQQRPCGGIDRPLAHNLVEASVQGPAMK